MLITQPHFISTLLLLTAGILAGIDVALARGRTWLGWAMVFTVVALLLIAPLDL